MGLTNDEDIKYEDIKLKDWLKFARTLDGFENISINEIFRDNETDYQEETASDLWTNSNNNIVFGSYLNIGIGTNTPKEKLDIDGNVIISSNLTVNDININNSFDKTAFIINQLTDSPYLDIKKNENSVLFINESGNIGINNNNPNEKLDINGNVIISSNLTVNDTSILNNVKFITNTGFWNINVIEDLYILQTTVTEYTVLDVDADHLVAWYKFDGDFTDSSGNGYDLTIGGGTPTTTNVEKVIGLSANFMSNDAYLTTSAFSLGNRPFSVSFLVKYGETNFSNDYFFVYQGDWTISPDNKVIFLGITSTKRYVFYGYNSDSITTSSFTENATDWVHLVYSVDETYIRYIYRNGVEILKDTTKTSFILPSENEPVNIGWFNKNERDFKGYMDDLRFYDKVLTPTEIGYLANKMIVNSEYKTLTYTYDDTDRFVFRDDETPYSWQEAYDEAIANGRRMPTKSELLDYLTSLSLINTNSGLFAGDIWCAVVAPEYANGRDYIQIGTTGNHFVGKSHTEVYGYPTWADGTNYYQTKYCEVKDQTPHTFTLDNPTECDILIVAGGGGGGGSPHGGGGGAGGILLLENIFLNSGTYQIKVGKGGNGGLGSIDGSNWYESDLTRRGNNGFNSSFDNYEAIGGGGGGRYYNLSGIDGGSGGGGNTTANIGIGLQPTSLYGGFGNNGASGVNWSISGGGGGAGTAGFNSGQGGEGKYFSIFTNGGSPNGWYGGGGGGSYNGGLRLTGGKGGGGDGGTSSNNLGEGLSGVDGTGGGGGGGERSGTGNGGNGGSGIVIIRYKTNSIDSKGNELKITNENDKGITIDNSGFVGFNNNSPQNTIDVKGNINIDNNQDKTALIVNQISNKPVVDIKCNTESKLFIDYQGNIGINNNNPIEKLHIIGNTKIEGTLTTNNLDVIGSITQINTQTYTSENLLIDNNQADGESIKIYHKNANYDIVSIYDNDINSTEVFTIKKNGYIGIFNSTPDYPLHIYSSAGKGIRVDCGDNDTEILRFTPNDDYPTSYGGALKYHGSGSGNANKFSITMDNVTGPNIEALSILQNGKTTFSAESIFNDKVGINSGSQTLIVPLQVGPGTNTSAFNSRSSVAILSGDSGGPTELCALSLINSRQAAMGTSCSLGFNLSKEWESSSKIKAISKGTNQSSDLTFETHTGSSLTEKVRICDNGNIGIGTINPTEKLTVYDGRIKIHQNSNTDNAVLHLLSNIYNTYLFTDKTTGSFYIRSHYNNDVIIDSNGNLGIGTTPSYKLHVNGDVNIDGQLIVNLDNERVTFKHTSMNGGPGLMIGNTYNSGSIPMIYLLNEESGGTNKSILGTRNNFPLQFRTDWATRMHISNTGNIGIGTESPTKKLHIKDGDIILENGDFLLENGDLSLNSVGAGIGIGILRQANYGLYVVGNTRIEGDLTINGSTTTVNTDIYSTEQVSISNDGTGPALIVEQIGAQPVVNFKDDGNSVFYIQNGGTIGINTDNPDTNYKLDIENGNTLINNGNLSLTGSNVGIAIGTTYQDGYSLYTEGNTLFDGDFTIKNNSNTLLSVNSNNIIIYKSLLPISDDSIDIGAPDKRIRDIFVGNNSIWFGDKYKMSINNDKLELKKRDISVIPNGLSYINGVNKTNILYYFNNNFSCNYNDISNINLNEWLEYGKYLSITYENIDITNINQIYDNDTNNYDNISYINTWKNTNDGYNIYLSEEYSNIGIKNDNPLFTLDINGDINFNSNIYHNGELFIPYSDDNVNSVISSNIGLGLTYDNYMNKINIDINSLSSNIITNITNTNSLLLDATYTYTSNNYIDDITFNSSPITIQNNSDIYVTDTTEFNKLYIGDIVKLFNSSDSSPPIYRKIFSKNTNYITIYNSDNSAVETSLPFDTISRQNYSLFYNFTNSTPNNYDNTNGQYSIIKILKDNLYDFNIDISLDLELSKSANFINIYIVKINDNSILKQYNFPPITDNTNITEIFNLNFKLNLLNGDNIVIYTNYKTNYSKLFVIDYDKLSYTINESFTFSTEFFSNINNNIILKNNVISDILTVSNAGSNITITEVDGIKKINLEIPFNYNSATNNLSISNLNFGINTIEPEAYLHIKNNDSSSNILKITNSNIIINTSIIPEENETIDIGSADKKIRDIYVGNNSIWIGEEHKMQIKNGKIEFKKRDSTSIPSKIKSLYPDVSSNSISDFLGINIEEFDNTKVSLGQWLKYAKSIDNQNTISTVNDLFDNEDNYVDTTNVNTWTINNQSNIVLSSEYTNIGVNNNYPENTLDLIGNVNINNNLDKTCLTINQQTSQQPIIDIKQNDNSKLFINNEGKIGIGTNNPEGILHIVEESAIGVQISNSLPKGSIILDHENPGGASSILFRSKTNRTGNDYGYIQYQDSNSVGAPGEYSRFIFGVSNDSSDFVCLHSEKGNIGIGTLDPLNKIHLEGYTYINGYLGIGTYNPESKLHLHHSTNNVSLRLSTNSQVYNLYTSDNNNSGGAGFSIQNITQNKVPFRIKANGNILLSAYDNNNVGIGIENPTEKLHIKDGNILLDNGDLSLIGSGKGVGIGIARQDNYGLYVVGNTHIDGDLTIKGSTTIVDTDVYTSEQVLISNDGTGPALIVEQFGSQPVINFKDDGNSVLYIQDGGNIGIGTENPQFKLDVQGDINISSKLTVNDTSTLNNIKFLTNTGGFWNINLLNNETVNVTPSVDEDILIYTHSGGSETQTTHTLTFTEDTICDILIIGGGGGGAHDRSGGGGAGGCLFYKSFNMNANETYSIKVGKGGTGGTTQDPSSTTINGSASEIIDIYGTIFKIEGGGGGGSVNRAGFNGGCGGGAGSQGGTLGGTVIKPIINRTQTTIEPNIEQTNFIYYGNIGGRDTFPWDQTNPEELDGSGGGGIGEGGTTTGEINAVDQQQFDGGKGGDGLYKVTLNGVDYNFKDYFGINGIQEADGYYYIGGGGGGGDHSTGVPGNGGKGGGGTGGNDAVGLNASGYG